MFRRKCNLPEGEELLDLVIAGGIPDVFNVNKRHVALAAQMIYAGKTVTNRSKVRRFVQWTRWC